MAWIGDLVGIESMKPIIAILLTVVLTVPFFFGLRIAGIGKVNAGQKSL